MSSATSIRIDALLHSLKELQDEKQCLEQKLNERKSQAQALERRVDNCNTKLEQVKNMHQKLTEMQKVAMQKVQQTQQQVDSLQQLNQVHSNKIKELNNLLQQEKNRGFLNIQEFEEKMSALSSKFISGRKFYKTEALQERIKELNDKSHNSKVEAEINRETVDKLIQDLEKLQLTHTQRTHDLEIPHEARLQLWSMLEEEEDSIKASLRRLQAEQQEICNLLQESDSSLSVTVRSQDC